MTYVVLTLLTNMEIQARKIWENSRNISIELCFFMFYNVEHKYDGEKMNEIMVRRNSQ